MSVIWWSWVAMQESRRLRNNSVVLFSIFPRTSLTTRAISSFNIWCYLWINILIYILQASSLSYKIDSLIIVILSGILLNNFIHYQGKQVWTENRTQMHFYFSIKILSFSSLACTWFFINVLDYIHIIIFIL